MDFFRDYFVEISRRMADVDTQLLREAADLMLTAKGRGGRVIVAGNGASASIASHFSVDLTKNAGVCAVNFNEADLITCLANDYGYERWLEKAVELYGGGDDVLVLISSSGASENILNAAVKAREMGMGVVTFSGFAADNALRQMGDVNLWADSDQYNIVESVHHVWLLAIVDKIAGNVGGTSGGQEEVTPAAFFEGSVFSRVNRVVPLRGGRL